MKNQTSDASTGFAAQATKRALLLEPNRREFLSGLGGAALLTALAARQSLAQDSEVVLNVAKVALPASQTVRSQNNISALNDGFAPQNSFDRSHPVYRIWTEADLASQNHATWVQYEMGRGGSRRPGRNLLGS